MIRRKVWTIVGGLAWLLCLACCGKKYSDLLSWEEYKNLPAEGPYVLEVQSKKGCLLYYGAFHSNDLNHPQFADIEKKWADFRPTLAMSEGSIWPLEETRDEAIRKHGEQGLVRFLAAQELVPIQCLDPPNLLQAKHLRNFFPAGEIKIYLILRQARINQMLGKDPNDTSYAENLLVFLQRYRTFQFPPQRLYDFEKMIAELFPDLEDWRLITDEYFYRQDKGKFMPEIHRNLMSYRDQHMLRRLIKKVQEGERIFAIVGRSHVVIQEPVLRAKFRSPDGLSD